MSEDGIGNKRPREDADPDKGDSEYLQQLTAEQVLFPLIPLPICIFTFKFDSYRKG
jgi:hypothetical protein